MKTLNRTANGFRINLTCATCRINRGGVREREEGTHKLVCKSRHATTNKHQLQQTGSVWLFTPCPCQVPLHVAPPACAQPRVDHLQTEAPPGVGAQRKTSNSRPEETLLTLIERENTGPQTLPAILCFSFSFLFLWLLPLSPGNYNTYTTFK